MSTVSKKGKTFSITVSKKLFDILTKMSEKEEIPRSRICGRIIENYIEGLNGTTDKIQTKQS